MKRYYSHYTFIYPDIYLKNHIVEISKEGNITNYFPFEKEIERTEFYSGWLFFIPHSVNSDEYTEIARHADLIQFTRYHSTNNVINYSVYDSNKNCISLS